MRKRDMGLSAPVSMRSVGAKEPDVQGHQCLNAADKMGNTTAPAVQVPNQHGPKFPESGAAQEVV